MTIEIRARGIEDGLGRVRLTDYSPNHYLLRVETGASYGEILATRAQILEIVNALRLLINREDEE